MSKVNRNEPKRSTASESRYSIFEFDRDFPDDAACLDYLVAWLYPNGIHCPKCDKVTKHYRDAGRPSYACEFCGHHEHPMRGTIFQDSATSLRLWFYAIYLMTSTRGGISAKQLERELGVTYKTAWRIANRIRLLMGDDVSMLAGPVEVDETYIGGRAKNMHASKRRKVITGSGGVDKAPVVGIVERGGKIKTFVLGHANDVKGTVMVPLVQEHVTGGADVYTDEHGAYVGLTAVGFKHRKVIHGHGVYVDGAAHTSTLEGFWDRMKPGIRGVYRQVSRKYLANYVDEYAFRYNHRKAGGRGIFDAVMSRVAKAPEAQASAGASE